MAKKKSETTTLTSKRTAEKKTAPSAARAERKVFERINYYIMLGGIVLLVLGFILMSGGRQEPSEFNYDEIYSTTRITISPILIVLGYAVIIFGILWRPKRESSTAV